MKHKLNNNDTGSENHLQKVLVDGGPEGGRVLHRLQQCAADAAVEVPRLPQLHVPLLEAPPRTALGRPGLSGQLGTLGACNTKRQLEAINTKRTSMHTHRGA